MRPDPHHVGDSGRQQLAGKRQIANFRHAGIAAGAGIAEHEHVVGVTSISGSSAARLYSSIDSKTRARPRCDRRDCEAADTLITAPLGHRLPVSTAVADPAV